MTAVEQERDRCAKIVERAIVRNRDSFIKVEVLKRIHLKIKKPRSSGTNGGPLQEQLELPFDY